MARALDLGGTERQLATLAASLDRSRFEPHVACLHDGGLRFDELRRLGVPVLPLRVASFRSFYAWSGARRLAGYIRSRGIRLVHTFDTPLNVFGVPVARASQTQVVVSSQRAFRDLSPGPYRSLLRVTDRMVDAIVVNCMAVWQHLVQDERVPPGMLRLCYNGIDTSVFHPCRPAPGADANRPLVIGTVAAIRPEKGLRVLLEAFAAVRARHENIELVVVGGGPALPALVEYSRELNIGSFCRFEPPTAAVADRLRAIDIFVLPSLSEALSNSLMEAMASGCAVVATSVGGNPELVSPDRTGLLVPPGDAAGLAAALELLLDKPALRAAMSAAAARFIAERFSAEASAFRMAEIYSELLDGQAASRSCCLDTPAGDPTDS